MSCHRRPHYRPVTAGYGLCAERHAHPDRPAFTRLHFRSVRQFASGFHPTRPRGKESRVHDGWLSRSCHRLAIASSRPRRGLPPPIVQPCPAHLPPYGLHRLQQQDRDHRNSILTQADSCPVLGETLRSITLFAAWCQVGCGLKGIGTQVQSASAAVMTSSCCGLKGIGTQVQLPSMSAL